MLSGGERSHVLLFRTACVLVLCCPFYYTPATSVWFYRFAIFYVCAAFFSAMTEGLHTAHQWSKSKAKIVRTTPRDDIAANSPSYIGRRVADRPPTSKRLTEASPTSRRPIAASRSIRQELLKRPVEEAHCLGRARVRASANACECIQLHDPIVDVDNGHDSVSAPPVLKPCGPTARSVHQATTCFDGVSRAW